MANTTNFGWETPDDTDLVKDGAAAIRTLGSSIDTSLVDLKGGTTGQVLAKASNTDMDFTWSNDAGISPTILDAKGDLISATGADTPARLAVGANDTVLTADSSTATGLKWAAPAAAGGFTLLATATLSSTGTFTFSSISGSYKHLFINVIDLIGSSNDAEYKMQINQTGSHSSRGIYYTGTVFSITSERNESSFGNSSVANCPIQRMYTTAGDFGDITAKSQIWVYDYASTTLQKNVSWIAGGNARFQIGSAIWEETDAITRIDFIPFAATTATGTVQLYGVS